MVAITSRLTAISLLALSAVANVQEVAEPATMIRIKCRPVYSGSFNGEDITVPSGTSVPPDSSLSTMAIMTSSMSPDSHIGFEGNTITGSEEPTSFESFTSFSRSVLSRTSLKPSTASEFTASSTASGSSSEDEYSGSSAPSSSKSEKSENGTSAETSTTSKGSSATGNTDNKSSTEDLSSKRSSSTNDSSASASSESTDVSTALSTSAPSAAPTTQAESTTSASKPDHGDYQLCYNKAKTYTFHTEADLAPFKIENCASDFFVQNDTMVWELSSPDCAPTADYPQFIPQGMWEMDLKAAPNMGVVTAFVLYGPGAMGHTDEVDFEWVGADIGNAEAMYFVNGQRVTGEKRIPAANGSNLGESYHRYGIEYNKDFINWWMDGQVVRTINNDGSKPFPSNLGLMKFGVWDGSNTNGWAGIVDWSKGPFYAQAREMKFTPYC